MLTFTRAAAAAVTALAIAAPAAGASDQYLVSPDAADSARPEPTPYRIADGRSPDRLDTRTNDTVVVPMQTRTVVVDRPDGFDWGDAGIGAAGGLAALVLAGSVVLTVPRRRRVPTAA